MKQFYISHTTMNTYQDEAWMYRSVSNRSIRDFQHIIATVIFLTLTLGALSYVAATLDTFSTQLVASYRTK